MSITVKTFTADEFYRLDELGFFDRDQRFELLDGQIVHRSDDVGPAHLSVVLRMTEKFVLALGGEFNVFPQVSLRLNADSAPMPDIYLAPRRADYYRGGGPAIADLAAIVEISDSSLAVDRGRKLLVYANAGVREYWIANLRAWTIEQYRSPGDRGYADVNVRRSGDAIAFDASPSVIFSVDELLGPRG